MKRPLPAAGLTANADQGVCFDLVLSALIPRLVHVQPVPRSDTGSCCRLLRRLSQRVGRIRGGHCPPKAWPLLCRRQSPGRVLGPDSPLQQVTGPLTAERAPAQYQQCATRAHDHGPDLSGRLEARSALFDPRHQLRRAVLGGILVSEQIVAVRVEGKPASRVSTWPYRYLPCIRRSSIPG